MNPIQAWHDEHADFARLLQLLQEQVDVFATGETPQYALMLDIINYLRDYSDRFHHPREDEAFRRLAYRRPEMRLLLSRLVQEHRVIAEAGERLRQLLQEAESDAMVPRSEIEVAAATYLVYYGNHIAREEEEVMPAAGEALDAADWQAAKDAAPSGQDPLFGAQPAERFRALRRQIAAEAA